MAVDRQTVDLSAYPDLVVFYLGMRVRRPRGMLRLFGLGPEIQKSWKGAAGWPATARGFHLVADPAARRDAPVLARPRQPGALEPLRAVTPLTRKSDGKWAGRRHPAGSGHVVPVWFWGYAAVSVMTALPSRITMCWPVSACSWVARSRARRCLLMRDS